MPPIPSTPTRSGSTPATTADAESGFADVEIGRDPGRTLPAGPNALFRVNFRDPEKPVRSLAPEDYVPADPGFLPPLTQGIQPFHLAAERRGNRTVLSMGYQLWGESGTEEDGDSLQSWRRLMTTFSLDDDGPLGWRVDLTDAEVMSEARVLLGDSVPGPVEEEPADVEAWALLPEGIDGA